MNKALIVMSVCITLSLSGMAQRKAKAKISAPTTCAEGIAAAKKQVHAEMQKTCLPLASKVMNAKKEATSFSADVIIED